MNSSVLLLLLFAMMTGMVDNLSPCLNPVRVQKDIISCSKEVYQSLRVDASKECWRTVLSVFPSCINRTMTECQKELSLPSAPTVPSTISTKRFCSYIVPFRLIVFNNCSSNYSLSVTKCYGPFQMKFKANKADPGLCDAYATMDTCYMEASRIHCNMAEYRNISTEFAYLKEKEYNPFCSESHEVPAETITTLRKVSLCLNNTVRILQDQTMCLKEIYQSFRADPSKDCPQTVRDMYPSCYNRIVIKCFQDIGIPEANITGTKYFSGFLVKAASIDNFTLTTFCSSLGPFGFHEFTNCYQGYSETLASCRVPFQQMFNASKGDPALCDAFTTLDRCYMEESKMHCYMAEYRKISTKYSFLREKKYNPFCSDSQVSSTATTLASGMLLSVFAVLFGVGTFW